MLRPLPSDSRAVLPAQPSRRATSDAAAHPCPSRFRSGARSGWSGSTAWLPAAPRCCWNISSYAVAAAVAIEGGVGRLGAPPHCCACCPHRGCRGEWCPGNEGDPPLPHWMKERARRTQVGRGRGVQRQSVGGSSLYPCSTSLGCGVGRGRRRREGGSCLWDLWSGCEGN